ncbi:helix-turn-helix domain-containing protein [Halobacterium wangiae]|uniref:helix-turn-helix domain-containing protein n=1 Tax=Halobacterium wangiae TaxID=2902623 RepID=UPI001E561425|nr:helix-turn-helix domain-containing protein [Halobacterium wangiae]
MSVIVEFTIPDEEFLLGEVLAEPAGQAGLRIELERLVPTGDAVIPFLWVHGENYEAFEKHINENPVIGRFDALDRADDWVLYRVEWADEPFSLLEIITQSGGAILEGFGNNGWAFRVRFRDHDALSTFYNLCTGQDIDIHIERSYTLTEKTKFGHRFDLTQDQREALVLALQEGYFQTPRGTSLADLADKLGISEQAVSNRIRRGNEKVLKQALLSSAADFR